MERAVARRREGKGCRRKSTSLRGVTANAVVVVAGFLERGAARQRPEPVGVCVVLG